MLRGINALMILAAVTVYGQAPESFFPSQVGNLWQYAGDVGTNTNLRISRDSIAADRSKILFHVYPPPYGELPRYRIDTLNNVYDEPRPQGWDHVYKLDADSGEAWMWWNNGFRDYYGWLYGVTVYPVFGIPTTVRIFRLGPFHPDSGGNDYYFHERHLASGFGLVLDQGEPAYMYWLRGCVINGDTFGIVVGVKESPIELASSARLYQNYPNPFNPTTIIEYGVAQRMIVRLRVFDVVGQQVGTLAEGVHEPGRYAVRFDGTRLSSGCLSVPH